MALKLDIGCGTSKFPGCIGIDFHSLPGVDIVHDLNQFPYPLDPSSISIIYMSDILEHLHDPFKVFEECYRLLKPNGLIALKVVDAFHAYAFTDPTHVKFFTELSFDFLAGKTREYYSNAKFTIRSKQVFYNPRVQFFIRSKRILSFLSKYLINIKQYYIVVFEKV